MLRSRGPYPVTEERDVELRDGREVRVRTTRTSDTRAMQALFYRLPAEDVRTRFFHKLTSLSDAAAQALCSVNYHDEMAFAAVVGVREQERIVGACSYYVDPRNGFAEVGYMVDPDWQGGGLGGILHARMVEYARSHGVRGFTADVISGNSRMLRVFKRGDHELEVTTEGGISEVKMTFTEARPSPTVT
jgi:acetyltransferase